MERQRSARVLLRSVSFEMSGSRPRGDVKLAARFIGSDPKAES